MPVCITLVHGTFAKHAAWCKDGSSLCTALRTALGDPTFAVFEWSGRNTLRARRNAARDLAVFLRDTIATHPEKTHVVISHSHGGNVVYYALRDNKEFRKKIGGIVCLSTPFLHARRRQLGVSMVGAIMAFVTVILCAVFVKWVLFVDIHHWSQAKTSGSVSTPAFGPVEYSIWAGSVLLLVVMRQAFVHLMDGVGRHCDAWCRELRAAPLDQPKALLIRCIGDEASALLSVAQLGGWIVGRFVKAVGILNELLSSAITIFGVTFIYAFFVAYLLLIVTGLLAAPLFYLRGDQEYAGIAAFGLVLGLLLAVVPCRSIWKNWGKNRGRLRLMVGIIAEMAASPLVLLVVPLAFLGFLVSVFFGPELALVSLLVEMTTEATPEGTWTTTLLSAAEAPNRSILALNHSEAYGDPRCHKLISEWLSALVH